MDVALRRCAVGLSNGYGWIKSMDSLGCVVDESTVARGGGWEKVKRGG